MSDERLLPCPFCGGEAKVAHEYTEEWKLEYVMCFRCGCSTPSAVSEDTVIQIWNTRKPMERIMEKLEEERKRALIFSHTEVAMEKAIKIVKGGGVDETD